MLAIEVGPMCIKAIIKMMIHNDNLTFYDHPKHMNTNTVDQIKNRGPKYRWFPDLCSI